MHFAASPRGAFVVLTLGDDRAHNRTSKEEFEMRFVSVRDLRGKSAEIWRELSSEREMVVTSNGRPIAVLATVDESNVEQALTAFRRARAIDAVAKMQGQSVLQGTSALSPNEVEQEIHVARRKRGR